MAQLNDKTLIGVEYFIAFGPRFNFEYVDTEPCDAPLSVSTIKGAVTGVPRLGSGMMLAFVGEEIDVRDFGSEVAPTDWGGSGMTSGEVIVTGDYTAIYNRPGGYWITVRDSSNHALAARFVRVMYRFRPPGFNNSLSVYDFPFPAEVDGNAQGTVDTGFAVKMRVKLDSLDYRGLSDPYLVGGDNTYNTTLPAVIFDKVMVGVFAIDPTEGYQAKPHLVCGGFIGSRTFSAAPGDRTISFTVYGPLYWLLRADMREQQYIDPGLVSMNQGVQADVSVNGGNPLTQDVLGLGYVPNHWLMCSPTVCAMHILQHLHVYTGKPDASSQSFFYPNPTMANPTPGQGQSFGTLSQFMDITVDDPNFDETAGDTKPGFLNFAVNDGKVLSNIRQLIDNEGWQFFERHDLRLYFGRKPQYRFTFIPDSSNGGTTGANTAPAISAAPYSSVWQPDWVDYWQSWKKYKDKGGSQSVPKLILNVNVGGGVGAIIVGDTSVYTSAKSAYDQVFGGFYSSGQETKPTGTYKFVQPVPVLELHGFDLLPIDVDMGGEGPQIQDGGDNPVRQVIVEKPPLGILSDAIQQEPPDANSSAMAGLPANTPPPNPRTPFANATYAKDPSYGLTGSQQTKYQAVPFQTATSGTNTNAGNGNFTTDAQSALSVNPHDFFDYYPETPRSYGLTLQGIKNVFTLDGKAYAQGRDKAERCRYSLRLPLGQVFGIGLGDLFAIWFYNEQYGAINWQGKLFEVVGQEMAIMPGKYFVWVDLSEVNPDE